MSLLTEIYQKLVSLTQRLNEIGANSKTTEEHPTLTPIDRDAYLRFSVSGLSYKAKLQAIIDEIATELALGNVPVVFFPVNVNFTTPENTAEKIRLKLNSDPNYVLQQGTLYIPYVQRIVLSNGIANGVVIGSDGTTFAIITEYFMITQGIEPNVDGVASIGDDGTEILVNGVRYFNTVDSRNFAPVDFYMGDIGSTDIWDAVNAASVKSTPNGTTVLFHATQGAEDRIWLYRGMQEEVGTGRPLTDEEDYRLFPADGETDPPPTYQETKPQIGFSGTSVLYIDNHEGRLISMESAYYQSTFTARRIRLGSFTRALIDTSGETAYPKVKNKWLVKMGTGSGTANIVISGTNYLITQNATPYVMENNFVATHAANILSSKNLTVIFNSDGYLEFDGLTSPSITVVTASGTLTGTVKTIPSVLINTPEFTEGVFDMFTEYDGKQINYSYRPRVIEGYNGFVLKQYDDITALLAGQSEQKPNALYLVMDASADTNITFGVGETKLQATYKFKGDTETGSVSDYTVISAPYATPKATQITKTANFTLDPTENDATIISEGKICTIDPITKTYPSAFTVAMKNDAAATNLVIVPKTGWSYQLNDADAVSLTTGGSNVTLTWTKGGTCTVILKGSTNKIMIDGGVE
jgi:hypothetical protein